MLVYSNTLWLDESAGVDAVLGAVARWLGFKTRETVKLWRIKENSDRSMHDGSHIESWAATSSFPILHAVRYTHRDSKVSGRQWVTEIGVRLEDATSPIQCSVLLRTSEISARVSAKVEVTRPRVVESIIRECSVSGKTPGLTVNELRETNCEALRNLVHDSLRLQGIVVISSKADKYPIDPERTRSLVVGLAEVYVIPPDTNTFTIAEILGSEYAAWLGAVNLIFPRFRYKATDSIPTRRLMPEDIDRMIAEGVHPETEILSLFAHRLNLPNSWRHITPEIVKQEALRQELQRHRDEASRMGDDKELINLFQEDNTRKESQIKELTSEIESKNEVIKDQDATIDELEFELEGLRLAIKDMAGSAAVAASTGTYEEVIDSFRSLVKGNPTPGGCLHLISHFFSDAVVVSDTPWKSAEKSASFRHGDKALRLLVALATDYRNALLAGKGDSLARKYFGDAYAAKESETVEHNKRAKEARTFTYKGVEVEASKHLRIGTKDSVSETLRVYFHWDADDKNIVIFHCGQHPPQR